MSAETAAEVPAVRSLFRKLAEVMGEVERVKKSGRNEFHRYDYATEADIVAAVREGMSQRHLMLVPDVESCEVKDLERKNGRERLATLRVRFTLVDGDSGETHSFTVLGEGTDQGDKATYKAMTGATKYALLKLFLIPTGDDPEQDDAPPARAPQRQQQRPPPVPDEGRREAQRQQAARSASLADAPTPPASTSAEPSEADRLLIAMREAPSDEQLQRLIPKVQEAKKTGKINEDERKWLGKEYLRCKQALRRALQ
jgi:ERF superfamily protein